ncbi:MAG: hypothetical protein ACRERV_01195 [Methylococcales bacterium]
MRDAIDLQQPELLPKAFVQRLDAIASLCREHEFSEALVKLPEVSVLVQDQDGYCMERRIVGIHYTRSIRQDIESKGLLVRTGNEIQKDFLDRFSHLFDPDEIDFLVKKWNSHQETQADVRDLRLWFNFTTKALGGSGTEYLLGLYGGEQISMGIEFGTSIGQKLANIGEPLLGACPRID